MDHLLGTKRTRLTDERTFDLLFVYANGRAIKKLSQPIGHPQHAWLDSVETDIQENESESECDDDDGVPLVVDVCTVLRVMTRLRKCNATLHSVLYNPARIRINTIVSFSLQILFGIIVVALHVTARRKFEL